MTKYLRSQTNPAFTTLSSPMTFDQADSTSVDLYSDIQTRKLNRETVVSVSTNMNAVASVTYVFSNASTLTLPAMPAIGDWVKILNKSVVNPIVGRNGSNIAGSATDLTVDIQNVSVILVYTDATNGWVIS